MDADGAGPRRADGGAFGAMLITGLLLDLAAVHGRDDVDRFA
jgi:hypothetical protein